MIESRVTYVRLAQSGDWDVLLDGLRVGRVSREDGDLAPGWHAYPVLGSPEDPADLDPADYTGTRNTATLYLFAYQGLPVPAAEALFAGGPLGRERAEQVDAFVEALQEADA